MQHFGGTTQGGKMALKKFSEVAKDGCCPKCGYAVMKRGVNAVTGNLAVGLAAGLATGGLLNGLVLSGLAWRKCDIHHYMW
jgi:hypothetical protein